MHVWEGPMPHSDLEAHRHFVRLADTYLGGPPTPPTEKMAAFVAELQSIWPETPDHRVPGCPWKWSAVDAASGPVWDCESVFSEWRIATAVVAALAEKHGLIWHDPQYPELKAGIRPIWDRHPSVVA
ncbi:hypothetical protein GCM10025873_13590 [Demequina sediminis]|nr:hypothetical protein GCM10025873_13590 [Demequina sediminis]